MEHFISTVKPHPLHKEWSFPLRVSSVNVTRSTVSCGFNHINWRNLERKTSFFVQWSGITDTLIKLMLTIDNNESQRNVFYLRSFDLCHRKKNKLYQKKILVSLKYELSTNQWYKQRRMQYENILSAK